MGFPFSLLSSSQFVHLLSQPRAQMRSRTTPAKATKKKPCRRLQRRSSSSQGTVLSYFFFLSTPPGYADFREPDNFRRISSCSGRASFVVGMGSGSLSSPWFWVGVGL